MQVKGFQTAALVFIEGDFGDDGFDAYLRKGDVDFVDELGDGLEVGIGTVGDDGIGTGVGGEADEVGELEGAVGFVGDLGSGAGLGSVGRVLVIVVVIIVLVLVILVTGDFSVFLSALFLPGNDIFNDGNDFLGFGLTELEDFAAGEGGGIDVDTIDDFLDGIEVAEMGHDDDLIAAFIGGDAGVALEVTL